MTLPSFFLMCFFENTSLSSPFMWQMLMAIILESTPRQLGITQQLIVNTWSREREREKKKKRATKRDSE